MSRHADTDTVTEADTDADDEDENIVVTESEKLAVNSVHVPVPVPDPDPDAQNIETEDDCTATATATAGSPADNLPATEKTTIKTRPPSRVHFNETLELIRSGNGKIIKDAKVSSKLYYCTLRFCSECCTTVGSIPYYCCLYTCFC